MPRLPELPAVALTGRYLPAASAQLGGDWYDAFQLPDGRLGMAIGDVVGRGFHAAAIMGQLRSGLRAYALDGMPPRRGARAPQPPAAPARAGPHGDGPLPGAGPARRIAGRVERRASPSPARARRTAIPDFMELPGSAPLGATRHPTYEEREHALEPGCALVLYTDGLVERPGESLDAGLERLRAMVRAGDGDLEHLGDALVHVLLPGGPTEDDAALLLGRALPLSDSLVTAAARRRGVDPAHAPDARALADEAGATPRRGGGPFARGVGGVRERHRARLRPGVPGSSRSAPRCQRRARPWSPIRDFGSWRAPRGNNRGRGLMLMQGLTDSVEVVQRDEGTTVQLSRRLGAEGGMSAEHRVRPPRLGRDRPAER